MKVAIENGEEILNMKLVDVLTLLTVETVKNDCIATEMLVVKSDTNHGGFNYKIICEKEDDSAYAKFKRLFKR